MTALLEVQDLTVHYPLPFGIGEIITRSPRRVVQAVNGVSLGLERGEKAVAARVPSAARFSA